MQEQDQLPVQMEDLQLGESYNDLLKEMYQSLKSMEKENYGMTEDPFYTPPDACKRETVDKLQLQSHKQKREIHQVLNAHLKGLLKLRRLIETNQKTNYRAASAKRRNIKYEGDECSKKKMKFDQVMESKKMRAEAACVEHFSFKDVSAGVSDDGNDFDEFDLS